MKKINIFKSISRNALQGVSLLILAIGFNAAIAQQTVHQVLFLNEGWYDYTSHTQMVPTTIGSYIPSTKTYTVVDTIQNVHFGSDLKVSGNYFYVAADTLLLKYDINTYKLTAKTTIKGIRNLALWNNQILVSRGDTVPDNSYFEVYDTALNFIYALDSTTGPKYASAGMTVYNDTAYLAINNAFVSNSANYVGLVGIIDLQNKKYASEINLGAQGQNPVAVMRSGKSVFTFNDNQFASSSITALNTYDRTFNTYIVAPSTGCGASAQASHFVYYQTYTANTLERFDMNSMAVYDTLNTPWSYYGMTDDTVNSQIYITTTDYQTYGTAYIMQYNGVAIDSFAVGVSPGTIALDARTVTGIKQLPASSEQLAVYPNPSSGMFTIQIENEKLKIENEKTQVEIYNVLGEKIYFNTFSIFNSQFSINFSSQPAGVYMLNVLTSNGTVIHKKIVKQ